jgi:hypothetical protein
LTCEQIRHMRSHEMIPSNIGVLKPSPGCVMLRMYKYGGGEFKIQDSSQLEVTDVITDADVDEVEHNCLHIEFGNFVDRYISRMFGSTTDRDVHEILTSVPLTKEQFAIYTEHSSTFKKYTSNTMDIVNELHNNEVPNDVLVEVKAINHKIHMHRSATGTQYEELNMINSRQYMNHYELSRMKSYYDKYKDEVDIYCTFRVSLAASIIKGRKGLWYHPDVYRWFRRSLSRVQPCIKKYVTWMQDRCNHLNIKRTYYVHNIVGEADLVSDKEIVDFKCSKRSHDFSWTGQGLAYIAMHQEETSSKIDTLQIFNPMMRTVWEYDCANWDEEGRRKYIEYLNSLVQK